MAYSTISKPGLHFNTKLYTGNGGSQSITGVGFQPDWLWFKKRNGAADSSLIDAVRGVRKSLTSNKDEVEYTESAGLSAFDSDGFSFDGAGFDHVNTNSDLFVAWCWKAANSSGSANTSGDINSTVSANTTAGFSIVSYTGTGSVATVGHGLGVAPKLIIIKRRAGGTAAWPVDLRATSGTAYLNETGSVQAYGNSTPFPSTAPTTTVFSIGTANNANANGSDFIAYCFAEKQGYSKMGKYEGNGNADGTFVYTGFKPAFTLIKRDATDNWAMHDNRRPERGGNPNDAALRANLADGEYGGSQGVDFLSNGFKARQNDGEFNASGNSYIYLAIAEEPLVANVGNGIPATAV